MSSEHLLRKAIELLNKIWLVYSEEICADQTDQIVWKSPRRLILRSGCLDRTTQKRPGTLSPLLKFPEHLCKTPRDRMIMLNFLQCNVAVTHMQCILDWLLEDISEKIEVALFLLKDPPLIVTMEPDGNPPISNLGYRHMCWRVTLKSGEAYAVDLTGAQYGWFDPVCPWAECFEKRCLGREVLLCIGFQGDENNVPLIALDHNVPCFTLPRVDNYYVSVQAHFSKSMKVFLKGMRTGYLCLQRQGAGTLEYERKLIQDVKMEAEMATLAADKLWSTFPWNSNWEQEWDVANNQRLAMM